MGVYGSVQCAVYSVLCAVCCVLFPSYGLQSEDDKTNDVYE